MPTSQAGRSINRFASIAAAVLAAAGSTASAQLRVCAWNISGYAGAGARDPNFKIAIFSSYQGRSLNPDVFIAQELNSSTGANAFLAVLNDTAAGSPGDWALAPFVASPDTSLAFYYRTSRVTYLSQTLVLAGGNVNGAPRDIRRYDVRLSGYTSVGSSLAIYGDHMKAGSASDDQARRLIEATAIRTNSNALPAGWHFIFGGDTNIQSSSQAAYQQFVGSQVTNRGRFFDPINTPGSWNNSSTYHFVHTQAPGGNPATAGGMDDRFDFLLLDSGLVDGTGFEYIGNSALAYSTVTWNDPNHSFRAWGNDGTSFNANINTTTNAMVGPAIATALKATADTDTAGGHLPVFLDLRVPAKVAVVTSIDFGQVPQNAAAKQILNVANGGDVTKWTVAGIANLNYSLAASTGFTAPGGSFIAPAGGTGNNHSIVMNTANLGTFNGTVTITSDSPDEPIRIVNLTGEVVGTSCYANCDGSTTAPVLSANDFNCFLNAFAAGDSYANCDGSTTAPVLSANDFNCFLNAFAAGCT